MIIICHQAILRVSERLGSKVRLHPWVAQWFKAASFSQTRRWLLKSSVLWFCFMPFWGRFCKRLFGAFTLDYGEFHSNTPLQRHVHTNLPICCDICNNSFLMFPNLLYITADIDNDICTTMTRTGEHIISMYL